MDFFEENELLAFLATINQLFILAAGPVVDSSLALAHNLEIEMRVQHPTFGAWAYGDLHTPG